MPELTPALTFAIVGLALVAAELLIFQLSVFWFLFIGAGALVASGVLWLLGSQDWTLAISLFVVASALVTAVGYRPLKRWQNAPAPLSGNDAIGQQVKVLVEITPVKPGRVAWSGTEWPAQLAAGQGEILPPGSLAKIEAVKGIHLIVRS